MPGAFLLIRVYKINKGSKNSHFRFLVLLNCEDLRSKVEWRLKRILIRLKTFTKCVMCRDDAQARNLGAEIGIGNSDRRGT